MHKELIFHYSSYWRAWSRILTMQNSHTPECPTVELNLTAAPYDIGRGWNEVLSFRIRAHATPIGPKDLLTAELPANIVQHMKNNVGDYITHLLRNADILPLISWEKYKRCNGGANLRDILVSGTSLPPWSAACL